MALPSVSLVKQLLKYNLHKIFSKLVSISTNTRDPKGLANVN